MREIEYNVLDKLIRMDWVLFVVMVALGVGSYYFVQSATHGSDNPDLVNAASQQRLWLIIGVCVYFILALINYQWFVRQGWLIYIASVLILIGVLIFGVEINRSKSWLRIFGFSVQPAELIKIGFAIAFAWFMVWQREHIKKFWFLLAACVIAVIPVILIQAQPDSGTAAVFFPITFFMLYIAGVRKRYLSVPVVGVVFLYAFAYFMVHRAEWNGTVGDMPRASRDAVEIAILLKDGKEVEGPSAATAPTAEEILAAGLNGDRSRVAEITLLKGYQLNRIRTFFDPDIDPLGAGWAIRQSLIAVGSGGLKGKGYMQGDQNIYGFLPRNTSHNDYIFPIIAEEFGFAGGVLMIAAQSFILLLILRICARARDLEGSLIAAGIGAMFFAHFFINVGMTINVVPVTGIPLPLTSYGGTFVLACTAGLGLVQSVWIHRKNY